MPTDFRTWSLDNLAKFAFEASDKIAAQGMEIQDLKADLKACMDAYRKLNLSINEKEKTET